MSETVPLFKVSPRITQEKLLPLQINAEVIVPELSPNDFKTKLNSPTYLQKRNMSTFEKHTPKEVLSYLEVSHCGTDVQEGYNSNFNSVHPLCTTKEFSIMFIDLRSVVNVADKMNVTETFEFLNNILARISVPISQNSGYIHKLNSDTVIALFGGSSENILNTSIQIISQLKEVQQLKRNISGRKIPDVYIGIHCGLVRLGTIRLSECRIDTSFFSNSLPIVDQLKQLARTLNSPIIVTNEIIEKLSKDNIGKPAMHYCSLGKFLLKDIGKSIELYNIFEKEWDNYLFSDERKSQYLKALEMFQQRKFLTAMTAFSKLYKQNENDLIAQFYTKASKMYQQVQPPQNWDGSILINSECAPSPIGAKSSSFYLQTGITAYHHFGEKQIVSYVKEKEEEIKLLNEGLSQKSVTIRDMKEILRVKEQEIMRLQEITDVLVKEKKQEADKLKHTIDALIQKKEKETSYSRKYQQEKKINLEKSMHKKERRGNGTMLSKCLPFLSYHHTRIAPTENSFAFRKDA